MFKDIFKKKRAEDYTHIVAKEQPLSYVTENFQKTLINLEYLNVDGNYKVIQMSSTTAAEGKTTILVNLAYLLKERGKKVLLVDLDLRRPKLHQVFDVANEEGLNDYFLDNIKKDKLVKTCDKTGLNYVLTGNTAQAVTSVLNSDKLKSLILEFKDEFDYVLIDSPPVMAVSDALFISKLSDGILFVVAQNKALKRHVKESIETLRNTGADIIGTILTQVKLKDRRYQNYYQYYE